MAREVAVASELRDRYTLWRLSSRERFWVRAEETQPAGLEGAHVAGREELRVADHQRRPPRLGQSLAEGVEAGERRLDRAHVGVAAVEALPEQRDRAVLR